MNNIIERKWKQGCMVGIEDLRGLTFQNEALAHTFKISGVDADGSAIALSGTPAGVMLRADNMDVALTCAISDGCVTASLPAECYDVPGRAEITIYLTEDGHKVCIYAAIVSVNRTSSGTASPGTAADVVDLVNLMQTSVDAAADSATAAAGSATSAAASAATASAAYNVNLLAPNFVQENPYPAGQHVIYDGGYYVLPNGHEADVTWANTSKTQLTVGGELTDLKSAIGETTGNIILDNWNDDYWYNVGGAVDVNTPDQHAGSSCQYVACEEGDQFTLTGTGGTLAYALHAFIDDEKNVLSKASSREAAVGKLITAPENSKYLVINIADKTTTHSLYRNEYIKTTLSNFLNSSAQFLYRGLLTSNDDIDGINKSGIYHWTSSNIPDNVPWEETIGGVLIQYLGTGARTTQYAYPVSGNLKSFYWRCKSSSGWLDWKEVVSSDTTDAIMETVTSLNSSFRNMIALITGNALLDNWTEGYWYNTGGSVVDVNAPTEHSGSACQAIACTKNDKFTITGIGGTTAYALYAFIDEDGAVVPGGRAKSREVAENKVITAPENAVYLVVNVQQLTDPHELYTGEYVDSRLKNLENNGEFRIPDYYFDDDYLDGKIDDVLERSLDIAGDSFVFITDYHAHKNAGNSPAIINMIHEQTGVSKVFCGGDIGTSTGLNSIKINSKAIKTLQHVVPTFLACVGNHEWKVQDSSTPEATYNSVYNYYINQMESESSCMSDFGDFWIDSKGAKIRYFFLNQNLETVLTDISLKWFIQELPNVPAGYGIVVVMHHAYHNKTYSTASSRKYFGMLNWWNNVVGQRNLTVRRISQILNAIRTGTTVKYALRPYDSSLAKEDNISPRDHTTAEKNSCGDYNPLLSTFAEGTNTGAWTDIVTFDGSAVNTGVYPIAIFCGHKHEDGAYDPASASDFSDMTDENTVYLLNGTWYRYDSDSESETYGQRVAMLAAEGASDLSQTETVPPILVILTTTDCYALKSELDPTERTFGTISEQAFDIVQIDTTGRKVYCTRIGGGNDREFSY